MIPKEDRKKLMEYTWELTIKSKKDPSCGETIEMNSDGNLENVFLEEVLVELANDLRKGEEQFEDYKKRGIIEQDSTGSWILKDSATGKYVKEDPSKKVEIVKDRKDLKGGEIKD